MANPKSVRNFGSVHRANGFLTKGQRLLGMKVINKTGSDIAADKLVAISGFDVTSKLPKIVLADADAADLATDVFISLEKITNGKTGNVYKGGLSKANLDTSGATTVGDPVYLHTTAGAFTSTAPTAVNARQIVVGYSTVKSASVGQLLWDIKPDSIFGSNDFQLNTTDTKVLATPSITYTSNATPATITGFSWTVAAGGTYVFDSELFTTMTTVGGLTVAFALTTATLTSIQYATYASTAADATLGISTQGTTATSGTKIFDSKVAAYTRVKVYGSFVVNAGGTFALQASQNTSAGGGDVSVVLFGSMAKVVRVL